VKTLALVVAVTAAALAAGPASATNECNGLMICVPVAGPWVVVPTGTSVPRPRVDFQLSCPRGYIVGGLDAELSDRAIDVTFTGTLGAPVNPGITTARAALFSATYLGSARGAPSFRPHVGCMPASGGGGIPTLAAVYPVGKPTVRRIKEIALVPRSRARVTEACASGERLVAGSHAVGFWTALPPVAALVDRVTAAQAVRNSRVVVAARAGALGSNRVLLQVGALCAGGQ
jgi:hypothetical protein